MEQTPTPKELHDAGHAWSYAHEHGRPQPKPNHTHDPKGCDYCASLEHAGNERHMA